MTIYSAQQKEDIKKSIEDYSKDSSLYFQLCAKATIQKFTKLQLLDKYSNIIIFAGANDNGLESLYIANEISKTRTIPIQIFIFNINNSLPSSTNDFCKSLAVHTNIDLHFITNNFEIPTLTKKSLILDGLFGGNLTQPLKGGFASIIKIINQSPSTIISIDIPSGLFDEDNTNNLHNHIIQADYTFTFIAPYLSLLLPDNQLYIGQLSILELELPQNYSIHIDTNYTFIQKSQIQQFIKKRPPFSHKGTYGNALIIAGKRNMAGAGILAATACLRSGIGKVFIKSAKCNRIIYQTTIPEAIFIEDEHDDYITSSIDTDSFNAIGIGAAIGTNPSTALSFIEQIRRCKQPLVIDADAFNILADHKGWLQQIPTDAILTPHPKEFQNISHSFNNSYQLLKAAINLAVQQSLFIILKGHYTAICTPSKKVYFNTTGNSGMATAGCGDVLTGIITALLGQKYNQEEACLLGVFLHGLAGDIAIKEYEEESLIARDIIKYIPKAFQLLKEEIND